MKLNQSNLELKQLTIPLKHLDLRQGAMISPFQYTPILFPQRKHFQICQVSTPAIWNCPGSSLSENDRVYSAGL